MTRLTGERPELAAFVRATRAVYLKPPPPAVRERHEAMIAAEVRRLAAPPARQVGFGRRWRLGLAAALAVGLAGVLVVGGPDDQPAPTVSSDRPVASPLSERAGSLPRQLPPPDETGRRRRPVADTRSAPPPVLPEPEATPPAQPEPGTLTERPPEVAPEPRPQRGFGGPGPSREPLEGPLDTEPPIPTTPESGGPAPEVPPP